MAERERERERERLDSKATRARTPGERCEDERKVSESDQRRC